ncbi:MAG TPA: Rnase Y domain-containing protein, partial [Dehalococcoidia bacterium]|nr:Rnase Y domain-containing protein [Dehalococcoidia bacterium]
MAILLGVVFGVLGLAAGALLGYALRVRGGRDAVAAARAEAERIIAEAQRAQRETLLEAKEEAIRLKAQAENELKQRRDEVLRLEQRIAQREENLDRKLEALERREQSLNDRERQLEQKRAELEELRARKLAEIERVSGLTADEAREILLQEIDREVREEAQARARDILTTAMQRLTTDVVSETTISVVPIPSDDMKGRIIGREGRNIRALEAATGVDLIIDDTPDAVMLSSFDAVRREIARVALTKLVTDGRIHPTRIEEVVEKARQEVEAIIKEAGEEAA